MAEKEMAKISEMSAEDAEKVMRQSILRRKQEFLDGMRRLADETQCRLVHTVVIRDGELPRIVTDIAPV